MAPIILFALIVRVTLVLLRRPNRTATPPAHALRNYIATPGRIHLRPQPNRAEFLLLCGSGADRSY